jgi:hypothetical protein
MDGVFVRILWFGIIATASAYIVYLTFGGIFEVKDKQVVKLRDDMRAGQHVLTGIVMVSSPCDELSAQTVALSPTVYAINLHTWYDPSVKCEKKDTPRNFRTIAFAPAYGVQFVVFLDGELLPFDLISVIPD